MDGAYKLGLEECVGCQQSKIGRLGIPGGNMA